MPIWLLASLPHAASEEVSSSWSRLVFALVLVALNGFFVAAEFALAKVRPTQIEPEADRGDRRAKVALHMVQHLEAYLSATQLGITLTSLALGWVGEPAFVWLLEPLFRQLPGASPALIHSTSLTAAFVTISVLHIVLGELVPKSLAIRKSQGVTLWIAVPFYLFYRVTYPAIWLLNETASAVLRLVGIRPATESELAHSEEELRLILASDSQTQLPEQKRDLLANIFELSDRVARQIMVPRADVVYLSTARSLEENLATARESGHTRLPLCDGDLDRVVGVVHIKDLFRAGTPIPDLASVRRPIKMVPETLALDRLLKRMLDERAHLFAVVDEYGGVAGIVTLENVLEEIVGQIQDEFDTERPELVAEGGDRYVVSGSMLVVDLEDELGVEISDRDEDTIAGVVLSELGSEPKPGARVKLGRLAIEVLETQDHRIRSLRIAVHPEEAPAGQPQG